MQQPCYAWFYAAVDKEMLQTQEEIYCSNADAVYGSWPYLSQFLHPLADTIALADGSA